jgi:hypothetical protein
MPAFGLWKNKLLLTTLLLFFLENSTYLRVFIRSALEGSDFRWAYYAGLSQAGDTMLAQGVGLSGHTAFILANAFVVALLLVMGLRRPDAMFRTALLAWTAAALWLNAWILAGANQELTHSRETLRQIALTVDWTSLIWPGLACLSALLLWLRGLSRRSEAEAAWAKANTILLVCSVAALVAAGLLLNFGAQHGDWDFIGMGLIYSSLFFMFVGLAPWQATTTTQKGEP